MGLSNILSIILISDLKLWLGLVINYLPESGLCVKYVVGVTWGIGV